MENAAAGFRLPRDVAPRAYAIDLTTTPRRRTFSGRVAIDVETQAPTDVVVLHARDLKLSDAVARVGRRRVPARVRYQQARETATLHFDAPLPRGAARLEISFAGRLDPRLRGLYLARSGDEVAIASQCEAAEARAIFPCFDEPDRKATFAWTVRTDPGLAVVTNGALRSVRRDRASGLHVHRFEPTPVLPTYLVAVTVGDYEATPVRRVGGVPCRVWVPAGKLAQAAFADEAIASILPWFTRYFGQRYHYGKIDQVAVPGFDAGAMENAGAIFYRQQLLLLDEATTSWHGRKQIAETIAHEVAHQWFGNRVTMCWWDDLWLNESFATYMSVLCQAEATRWGKGAWTTFANVEKAWAYRQDQLPSTHPIAADIPDIRSVEVNFDGITYAKGASVLKQLVAYVGLDNFLAGVRDYFNEHKWGNTTLQDLLTALERTSGRDLSSWSKEWLETAGVNTLRPSFTLDDEGRFASFEVLQEAPAEHPTLRSHRIAIGLYSMQDGVLKRTKRVELDVTGARTAVPELVGERRPDLVLVNDDDLTYAKIRLDDHSLATLVNGGITAFEDSLPRALCWAAAWDMTRDAEMATRDYVKLVTSGIDSVRDITVVQSVLRQARQAVQQYADPAWRATGLAELASALRRLIASAAPGSDHQLAYVNALAAVATSPEDLAFLRGILDGTSVPEGLTVDTDLRWTLTHALVVGGVLGEADIDAELARDATATGERSAAMCRAAIPTPEAKERAWASIIGGRLSNAVLRSTILGFVDPHHVELLEPYAEKYFAEVDRIWREWTSDSAQNFVVGCYPALLIRPETVQRTHEHIERAQPPAALRRLLLEGADGISRALRAQAKDAAAA